MITRTVTAKNAGRSLPGLRPLRTVEQELRPRPTVQQEGDRLFAKEKAEGGSAEGKGLIEQSMEAGGALGTFVLGHGAVGPKESAKVGETLGKNNPIAADERNANKNLEAAAEEVQHKVESVESWTGELSHLLSRGSLENLGKIVAGGLLLLIAVLLLVRAMGGPSPSIGKIPAVAALGG